MGCSLISTIGRRRPGGRTDMELVHPDRGFRTVSSVARPARGCAQGCLRAVGTRPLVGPLRSGLRTLAAPAAAAAVRHRLLVRVTELQAATCATVGASPAKVVRRMSRTSLRSKRQARCIVARLSQITRSYCFQACE